MEKDSLAWRLREARKHKGWSQTELAKRSKINNVQISKLERGITKDITGGTLRALCTALDVSPSYILGMSNPTTSL